MLHIILIDGRLKPDVLAPGQFIVSALSDENIKTFQCNGLNSLRESHGTSMSAPVVAGHAALVRQYFMEGWYPLGRKVKLFFFQHIF